MVDKISFLEDWEMGQALNKPSYTAKDTREALSDYSNFLEDFDNPGVLVVDEGAGAEAMDSVLRGLETNAYNLRENGYDVDIVVPEEVFDQYESQFVEMAERSSLNVLLTENISAQEDQQYEAVENLDEFPVYHTSSAQGRIVEEKASKAHKDYEVFAFGHDNFVNHLWKDVVSRLQD